jgi:hypothetical protein
MEHRVEKGLIYSKKGIPAGQRWFADNRLAIQFDETGVTRVEYRNPEQQAGNPLVFLKGIHDGFRYYMEQSGVTAKAEYLNNMIWPFGMDSEWDFQSVIMKHSIYTINDSIIVKLVTPEKIPTGLRFKLEFNEPFSFVPADQSNFLLCGMGADRTWERWEFNDADNILRGRYVEKPKETVHGEEADIRSSSVESEAGNKEAVLQVLIGADFPLEHVKRSSKHILCSKALEGSKEYHFVAFFAAGGTDAVNKFRIELGSVRQSIEKQFNRYRRIIDSSPELLSPYQQLNEFVSLSPLYHEALKATEYPGAIRAKTSNYWVWGWDGITANCASLYWGDVEFIRDMLRFYEKTAHPQRGIAHAYRNDMSVASISDLPAQGMYIALLHHYYNATKDVNEVKERYAFAKKIYKSIAASEVEGTGFCEGTSLFPDYPVYMKETGHDISAFNNTVFYCASRSMEYLASLIGDEEMCSEALIIFKKMEGNFIKLFYNEDKKFIVNSIDAKTLEKRECYSSDAVKWENEYCSELFESISQQCMEFFAGNFVCKAGIRPMPVWDSAFDADANQLHSWWPVMGEYYMKLINENNRVDLINQWIGWVSYWTEKLTIPEGIPCYIDTSEPEHDRWDTLCGTWQAYSVRGWYQALLHGVVGVGMDAGGITFYPYEGEEMTLKGMHYLGNTFDIEMHGSGRYIESMEVDGQIIKGTNKLPADLINKKHILIKVKRVRENPYAVYVKHASGLEFTEYNYREGILTTKLKGAGTSRIKLVTSKELLVKQNGEEVGVQYNRNLKLATVEVKMLVEEIKELEVVF